MMNQGFLSTSFKKLGFNALKNMNFQPIRKFESFETFNRPISAVELDQKRFCIQLGSKEFAFNYDEYPVTRNDFKHIQELRIYRQPVDIKIYDDVFGHDIKRIHIWDKKIPEKYCNIQKSRNSLEEVYIYSKRGFDHLLILSPSCRKVEVMYFKLENIKNLSYKESFPSIEHLMVSEAYVQKNLDPKMVKQFCEFLSKAFPNLKQLDIEFDYLNHYIINGSAFDEIEPFPKIDPKMFEVFPSGVKGTIKFKTFKNDEIFEKCAQIVKDTSVSIDSRHGRQKFFQKYEIHDGLLFESIVSFGSDNGLCWHPFFGYKGVPIGRFSFQSHMYNARNKGDDTIPFRFTD